MSNVAEPSDDRVKPGMPAIEDEWPEPPQLFTKANGLLALGLLIFATAMSFAILTSRQMKSEKTSEFWGEEIASVIRSGRPVELLRPEGSQASKELEFYNEGWIDLSELRDLGYFRRVFLDDESFDWNQTGRKAPKVASSAWPWAFVRFGYRDEQAPGITVAIHLDTADVGLAGSVNTVPFTDNIVRRIAYRLRLFAKVEGNSD